MVFSMIQQRYTYFWNLQQMDVYSSKFERETTSNKILLPFILDRLLVGSDFYIVIMLSIAI